MKKCRSVSGVYLRWLCIENKYQIINQIENKAAYENGENVNESNEK